MKETNSNEPKMTGHKVKSGVRWEEELRHQRGPWCKLKYGFSEIIFQQVSTMKWPSPGETSDMLRTM
jgi:hypothetical protein